MAEEQTQIAVNKASVNILLPSVIDGIVCRSCHHKNELEAKFCEECGFGLSALFCKKCGSKLEDGDIFCGECGEPQSSIIKEPFQINTETLQNKIYDLLPCKVSEPREELAKIREVRNIKKTSSDKNENKGENKYNFVSSHLMSESDNIFKAVKAIKKSKINEEPDDERLKDFGGSEDNLFFKLEYTLIGEIPAFVSCHIFYMGTEIPSDRLKFSGDIWKIVCPGWHQFTWNLKNHPDLLMAIPDGISGVTFNFSLKTKEV